jgi:hypothetical protein
MKYYLIIFIVIINTLCACNTYTNNVVVKNSSDKVIDSVLVLGNTSCKPLKFSKISQMQTKTGNLLNCKTKNQGDGSFAIKVYMAEKVIESRDGYFTNGYSIFKKIEIEIDKDYKMKTQIIY